MGWALAVALHHCSTVTNVRTMLGATDRKVFMVGTKRTALLHCQFGVILALAIALAAITGVRW